MTPQEGPLRVVAASATDVGRVREGNEDAFIVTEKIFAVADGMGGHRGGEVASGIAARALADMDAFDSEALVTAIEAANDEVVAMGAADPELDGMGTTLVALALEGSDEEIVHLALANVGDSRAYVLSTTSLEQLTVDHTVVEQLLRSGAITARQAANHPQRNVITRALGIAEDLRVDTWELDGYAGDRFLLCSDGLSGEVPDDEIEAVLRNVDDPAAACAELIRLANEAGGTDNITCVVVDVVGEGAASGSLPGYGRVRRMVTGDQRAEARSAAERRQRADRRLAEGDAAERPLSATGPMVRPRRVTGRVVVFVIALVAIVAIVVLAIATTSNSSYFVGVDGDEVVVWKGKPGGVLWFEPSVDHRTGLDLAEVPERLHPALDAGKEFSSIDDADAYVTRLRAEIEGDEDTSADDDDANDGSGGAPGGDEPLPIDPTFGGPTSAPTVDATTATTTGP